MEVLLASEADSSVLTGASMHQQLNGPTHHHTAVGPAEVYHSDHFYQCQISPLRGGEDGCRQVREGAAHLSTTQRFAAHTHTHTSSTVQRSRHSYLGESACSKMCLLSVSNTFTPEACGDAEEGSPRPSLLMVKMLRTYWRKERSASPTQLAGSHTLFKFRAARNANYV